MTEAHSVLTFWFGNTNALTTAPELSARWYKKDPGFDREIRARFLDLYLALLRREHESWLEEPEPCLAYLITLDQFGRNMFRDTALAFAADPVALRVAQHAITRGYDLALVGDMRAFMYLPLMHSEDLGVQEECVRCFHALCNEMQGELKAHFENNLSFAVRHRDIVARFGRFPHRNALLGRTSSPEELAFLEQPGSGF